MKLCNAVALNLSLIANIRMALLSAIQCVHMYTVLMSILHFHQNFIKIMQFKLFTHNLCWTKITDCK